MKVSMIRTALMAALIMAVTQTASAKEVYKKEGDSSVVLTVEDDGTARITKAVTHSKPNILTEGKVNYDTNSLEDISQDFLIQEKKDGICPQIRVQMVHDISTDKPRTIAKVESLIKSRNFKGCQGVEHISGIYVFSQKNN